MNILDFIIILVLAVGFILGFKDGFVRKLIGLIGLVLAVFLSIKFADWLGTIIEEFFGIEYYLAQIMGGIAIFLLIILLFAVIKRIVHPFDKVNNLINQLLGGAVGVIQLLFFLSAVFFLMNIFDIPDEETSKNSLLYNTVYDVIPFTIEYVKDYTPDSKQILDEFIFEKDSIKLEPDSINVEPDSLNEEQDSLRYD